jgi:uncharacterized protein (TIGR00297 family)
VLTRSGSVAALLVGVLTVLGARGHWIGVAVLFAFFIPSVALSRAGASRKRALVEIPKGGPRDAWQVVANGGIATLCALLGLWPAYAGAYAAATADTWATEIGSAFGGTPRSIVTWRAMARGFSGGVTLAGNAAMLAGAAWIAAVFAAGERSAHAFWIVLAAGVAGALVDSLLGATLQRVNVCPLCIKETELAVHGCGTPASHARGLAWLSNDAVNFAATATGALIAGLL